MDVPKTSGGKPKKILALKQQQMKSRFVSVNLGSEQSIYSAVVMKSTGR